MFVVGLLHEGLAHTADPSLPFFPVGPSLPWEKIRRKVGVKVRVMK